MEELNHRLRINELTTKLLLEQMEYESSVKKKQYFQTVDHELQQAHLANPEPVGN